MKYDDKRPPAPRLMRPEDVNRAVRRTSPRKNRRSRPSAPPPSVEEHKNNLNNVARQSADKTRQKIEDEKARKIAEEKERKEQEEKEKKRAEEKSRIQSIRNTRVSKDDSKKVSPKTSSPFTVVQSTGTYSYKNNDKKDTQNQENSSVSISGEKLNEDIQPMHSPSASVKKSLYDPVLENNKEKQEYDEIIADPNVIYKSSDNARNADRNNEAKKETPKSKTSTPSPSELARTIENSKKHIKPKRTGVNISVVTMSLFSVFLMSSLSVLGAYSYGIYKDSTAEKIENAAYEKGVQDSTSDPTVETVMRVNPEKMTEMIMSSPNANFPPNPVLTNFKLTGYSIPGGDEGRGRANVNFCYAANDIEGKRSGRAYFVSDDANAQEPFWRVDAVNITQDPCN